jgi:hypothetical protein
MQKLSLKKQLYFASAMFFLFLLSFSNQVSAKVDASKYGAGFNATDATSALQGAIDSKADTVLVPYMGADWIVRPIFLRSANQTIIFENKVVVTAKKGEFHGGNDCLFSTRATGSGPWNINNITLIGYGATFKMQKADYMTPAYGYDPANPQAPQWRNCVYILASSGHRVLGLTLKDSGGDGVMVYYGASNVLIKDVICDNHYRQGMSPCDFRNLTIENCVIINTGLTGFNPAGPCAGIDFEPDHPPMFVQNGKLSNCYLANNMGGEILVAFWLTNTTDYGTASIDIKHCFISSSGGNSGIILGSVTDTGIKGTLSFEDCIIEAVAPLGGLRISGKAANTYLSKFTDCLWQNCNPAIKFWQSYAPVLGDLQFVNSAINEPDKQFTIQRDFTSGTFGVANITGNLKINSPYGLSSASLGGGTNVTLKMTEQKSKPPVVTSVKPDKGKPDKVTYYNAGDAINISAAAYDPDIGTTDGAGIQQVDFAFWRGNGTVVSYIDKSAPFTWPVAGTSTSKFGGIYLIRITAYSSDGSYTVAVVPIYVYNAAGPGADGTVIPVPPIISPPQIKNYRKAFDEGDFLFKNTSNGFKIYSPFATDSRIIITDLSGRQVTLTQTVKGKSWNNIPTQNKLSSNVYFIQTTDKKGNSNIVKKAMIVE